MDSVTNQVQSVTNQVQAIKSTSSGMVVLTLIAAGIAIFFIAIILYWLITKYVQNRTGGTISETYIPVITSALQRFKGNDLPALANGRRLTLTFWMYIYDIERFKGVFRNVFYIGTESGNISSDLATTSPPISVVLDDSSNQLHIIVGSNSSGGDFAEVKNDMSKIKVLDPVTGMEVGDDARKRLEYMVAKRGMTIDYIPLQRWVHVALVLNETVNGGYMQTYIDGELVGLKNNTTKTNVFANNASVFLDVQGMTTTIAGDVFVGGSAAISGATVGFSGLVSKISMYNYDLNAKDIYDLYLAGPVASLMSKVGLSAYGLRSPIARVGADS